MVTPEQIRLVQDTFEMVRPSAAEVATTFYGRLFEIDPGLRPMFRGDMKAQGEKLMQMLAMAVRGLNHIETLAPAVEKLGARHAGYGVENGHYSTVASALLWTLEHGLGAAFTAEVRGAWTAVYQMLATTMQRGAEQALEPDAVGG